MNIVNYVLRVFFLYFWLPLIAAVWFLGIDPDNFTDIDLFWAFFVAGIIGLGMPSISDKWKYNKADIAGSSILYIFAAIIFFSAPIFWVNPLVLGMAGVAEAVGQVKMYFYIATALVIAVTYYRWNHGPEAIDNEE